MLVTDDAQLSGGIGAGRGSAKLSVPAVKLPSGYAVNASGNVVGPKGGIYTNTGKIDAAGNTIYSSNSAYYVFSNGVKSGVSSPNVSNQIRQNYEQGKSYEDKVHFDHSVGKVDTAREVTLKTQSGTNVRVDIISRDKQSNIACVECKSSATAPLTPNQKAGFPEIEKSGATVIGVGKPGFEGGTKIPPTKVEIIRPGKEKRD